MPSNLTALLLALLLTGCAGAKYRPYADLQLVNHRNGARSSMGAGVSIISPSGLIVEAGPVLTFRPEDVGGAIQDRSAGISVSMRWIR